MRDVVMPTLVEPLPAGLLESLGALLPAELVEQACRVALEAGFRAFSFGSEAARLVVTCVDPGAAL